jgi:hypothetical protein
MGGIGVDFTNHGSEAFPYRDALIYLRRMKAGVKWIFRGRIGRSCRSLVKIVSPGGFDPWLWGHSDPHRFYCDLW